MLAARGIISAEDRDALHAALAIVAAEVRDGTFPFAEDDEDVHMAIERRVTELAGERRGRLHTARSRNDQVATDMAMFTREAAIAAAAAALDLARDADRRCRAPHRLADARLHAPSARAAGVSRPPSARVCVDAAAR